jgi:hypothetical protein
MRTVLVQDEAGRQLLNPQDDVPFAWFDPLAAGIDVLPEKHAYSHAIALSSGAQAYLNLGDEK